MKTTMSDAMLKLLRKCAASPMGYRIAQTETRTSAVLCDAGLIQTHDRDPSLVIITDEGERAIRLY